MKGSRSKVEFFHGKFFILVVIGNLYFHVKIPRKEQPVLGDRPKELEEFGPQSRLSFISFSGYG